MRRIIQIFVVCLLSTVLLCFALNSFVHSSSYSGIRFSEEERKVKIYLDGKRIIGDSSESLKIEGSTVTIYKGGSYQFEGKLEDGQIIVDADKDKKVEIKLNSVDITCKDSCPILVKSAKKVVIKLKAGSVNHLSDAAEYRDFLSGEIAPKACIYSKDDLTIKGAEGTLLVDGNYKHGIFSSDDLRIKSGIIEVNAVNTALRGNDSVKISEGQLRLHSLRDGIYSKGLVDISQGKLEIEAKRYGIFGMKEVRSEEGAEISIQGALSDIAGNGKKNLAKPLER